MGDRNNSTMNHESNSSPRKRSVAATSAWTLDNRFAKISTHEVGNEWTIGRSDKITLNGKDLKLCHWSANADIPTPSTLNMFGMVMGNDGYRFVCSNSNQDGLELSSITMPSPSGCECSSSDSRVFHSKPDPHHSDNRKIFHHCASDKYVSVDERDSGVFLVLQENPKNAHKVSVTYNSEHRIMNNAAE